MSASSVRSSSVQSVFWNVWHRVFGFWYLQSCRRLSFCGLVTGGIFFSGLGNCCLCVGLLFFPRGQKQMHTSPDISKGDTLRLFTAIGFVVVLLVVDSQPYATAHSPRLGSLSTEKAGRLFTFLFQAFEPIRMEDFDHMVKAGANQPSLQDRKGLASTVWCRLCNSIDWVG